MKTYTTNYQNTFVEIAEDCPASKGIVPPLKNSGKSLANIQYELIGEHPYKYTSDDVLFECYATKNQIQKNELSKAKEQFFSKGQPCFRASPLSKQYGWGIHFNNEGKIAVYGCESKEYKSFSKDKSLKILKALRSKKVQ